MTIIRSEFALALNQVASERGIEVQVIIETIKQAILAAYRKDYGSEDLDDIEVNINPNSGEARLLLNKKDITPAGFGRIAAQTAKQVILQRVREAEKSAVFSDYQQKVGTVINGMILRFDGPNILVDIGKAQGTMPPNEQIKNEEYTKNKHLAVYIKEIREGRRGNEIIVSRTDPKLIVGLFEHEVPEVAQKAVQIKSIARESGLRSKIAVFSDQQGVDPVGSCVGQKGVRVQAVINELGGEEKIDIIQWSDDAQVFITQALSPAVDLKVIIDEEKKHALVLVPEEQLSLAIGRNGQNVRLAAKLTGFKIDIRNKEEYSNEGLAERGLEKLKLPSRVVSALTSEGITTKKELSEKTDKELLLIKGIGKKALDIIHKAYE